MIMKTYLLGLLLTTLTGSGVVYISDSIMYEYPEGFFGVA